MYVAALGQAAEVRSTCPVTRDAISLKITPDEVTNLDPASAVISIVIPAETETCKHGYILLCGWVGIYLVYLIIEYVVEGVM